MISQRLCHGSKHINKNPDKENIYQNHNNINFFLKMIIIIFPQVITPNSLRMRRMNNSEVVDGCFHVESKFSAVVISHGSLDSRGW